MPQLIVSISGIRGIVGDGLGPAEARAFGLAFGAHLGGPEGGGVVLGRDSRPSGPMLAEALKEGFLRAGCGVLDVGVLSTPGVAVAVRHLGAAGGAVVTASHNPAAYNGIKLLSSSGRALSREDGRAVRDRFQRRAFTEVSPDAIGRGETVSDAACIHVERVLGVVDAEQIRRRRFRVALDPVNGAGGAEMVRLLESLGCRVHAINVEPTGEFGRGPEPTPENLADLAEAVCRHGAAVGFALDPDADRLSLVDETGRPVGEEYTLALVCRHRLSQERGPLAANLSTSRMLDEVAESAGVTLYRTPVGELNVAEAIEREGCLIGGEGNGGVIDPRICPVRDSLVGAALILEMMATSGRPLSEHCSDLPVYTMVKEKAPLGDAEASEVLEAVRRRFPEARLDERDGVHLAWENGWLHVRASNTEPILRIIAEATEEHTARSRVREVMNLTRPPG